MKAPIAAQIEVDARYAAYVERQEADIEALRRNEAQAIPVDLDFAPISGLSNELKQKLERYRPSTMAQAGRIDGMTPAALMLVLAAVKKAERRGAGERVRA